MRKNRGRNVFDALEMIEASNNFSETSVLQHILHLAKSHRIDLRHYITKYENWLTGSSLAQSW